MRRLDHSAKLRQADRYRDKEEGGALMIWTTAAVEGDKTGLRVRLTTEGDRRQGR